jgi:hypothetical protein
VKIRSGLVEYHDAVGLAHERLGDGQCLVDAGPSELKGTRSGGRKIDTGWKDFDLCCGLDRSVGSELTISAQFKPTTGSQCLK